MEKTTDPVCGMKIKDKKIVGEHGNVKYYFCSDKCKTNFDANPEKYMQTHETHHSHEHKCC